MLFERRSTWQKFFLFINTSLLLIEWYVRRSITQFFEFVTPHIYHKITNNSFVECLSSCKT